MNWDVFEPLARTVLYEGHVLYPYRPSALKNQHAFTFGTLHPPSSPEASGAGFAVLVEAEHQPAISLQLCFLQAGAVQRFAATAPGTYADSAGGLQYQLHSELTRLRPGLWRLSTEVDNLTSTAEPSSPALQMGSAQVRCALSSGAFVSLQDPPPALVDDAAGCHGQGLYPVLIGPPGERRFLLAAPIILEDYPRIAPQSPGDFCDATEMDELLALRVLTLSEAEKSEIRAAGGEAGNILRRCESLPGVASLHGSIAAPAAATPGAQATSAHQTAPWEAPPPESVRWGQVELRVGDRVRLHPSSSRRQADLFNRILDGRLAHIQAIEQDLDGDIQLAVVAEDDPGSDLGQLKQTGHRFFYSPSEVEPL